MKVTVVGTGYVGLVSSACLARWATAVCLDVDAAKIAMLRGGGIGSTPGPGGGAQRRRRAAETSRGACRGAWHAAIHRTVGTPPDEDSSSRPPVAGAVGRRRAAYRPARGRLQGGGRQERTVRRYRRPDCRRRRRGAWPSTALKPSTSPSMPGQVPEGRRGGRRLSRTPTASSSGADDERAILIMSRVDLYAPGRRDRQAGGGDGSRSARAPGAARRHAGRAHLLRRTRLALPADRVGADGIETLRCA